MGCDRRSVIIQLRLILGDKVFELPALAMPAEVLAALQPTMQAQDDQACPVRSSRRFALEKGQGAWGLTYDGEHACFLDGAGMDFVEYLLKHPGQPLHPVALLANALGEAPMRQRSAALDDAEATRKYLREMDRLRAVIESDEKSDAEKRVAEEELVQLEQSGSDIRHRTLDQASRAAKTVRQAIRRVIRCLARAKDQQGRPHRILTAFAAHLVKHLLGPSQPGSAPAGHLLYEPPAGVIWE